MGKRINDGRLKGTLLFRTGANKQLRAITAKAEYFVIERSTATRRARLNANKKAHKKRQYRYQRTSGRNTRFLNGKRGNRELADQFARKCTNPDLVVGHSTWTDAKSARSKKARQSNQGMTYSIKALTGDSKKVRAKHYRNYYDDYLRYHRKAKRIALLSSSRYWNWCHLIAHSQGGAGGPENIVAGTSSCNSEQMALEHSVSRFAVIEQLGLQFMVRAVLFDDDQGRFMGDVIEFKVCCSNLAGRPEKVFYIDCQNDKSKISDEQFDAFCAPLNNWLIDRIDTTFKLAIDDDDLSDAEEAIP